MVNRVLRLNPLSTFFDDEFYELVKCVMSRLNLHVGKFRLLRIQGKAPILTSILCSDTLAKMKNLLSLGNDRMRLKILIKSLVFDKMPDIQLRCSINCIGCLLQAEL